MTSTTTSGLGLKGPTRRRRVWAKVGSTVGTMVVLALAGGWLYTGTASPIVTVATPSMVPTLHVGDMALMESLHGKAPKVGEIVVAQVPAAIQRQFQYPPTVTHRVVSIKNGRLTTKGDANSTKDPFDVPVSSVHLRLVTVIPGLGRFVRFLVSPFGLLWIGFGILIIAGPKLLQAIRGDQAPAASADQTTLGELVSAVGEYGHHLQSHTAILQAMSTASEHLAAVAGRMELTQSGGGERADLAGADVSSPISRADRAAGRAPGTAPGPGAPARPEPSAIAKVETWRPWDGPEPPPAPAPAPAAVAEVETGRPWNPPQLPQSPPAQPATVAKVETWRPWDAPEPAAATRPVVPASAAAVPEVDAGRPRDTAEAPAPAEPTAPPEVETDGPGVAPGSAAPAPAEPTAPPEVETDGPGVAPGSAAPAPAEPTAPPQVETDGPGVAPGSAAPAHGAAIGAGEPVADDLETATAPARFGGEDGSNQSRPSGLSGLSDAELGAWLQTTPATSRPRASRRHVKRYNRRAIPSSDVVIASAGLDGVFVAGDGPEPSPQPPRPVSRHRV